MRSIDEIVGLVMMSTLHRKMDCEVGSIQATDDVSPQMLR